MFTALSVHCFFFFFVCLFVFSESSLLTELSLGEVSFSCSEPPVHLSQHVLGIRKRWLWRLMIRVARFWE